MANHQKTISPARPDHVQERVARVVLDLKGDLFVVFRLTPAGDA